MKKYLFLLAIFAQNTFASQTGTYAWETVLDSIIKSLTGQFAYALSVIAIAVCGLTIAFTDLQSGAKKMLQACCGLSITVFAAQIVTGFLGFNGAIAG